MITTIFNERKKRLKAIIFRRRRITNGKETNSVEGANINHRWADVENAGSIGSHKKDRSDPFV